MHRIILSWTVGLAALAAADLTIVAGDAKLAAVPLPEGWSASANGAKTTIVPSQKRPYIQVWVVGSADVAAAEKDIAKLIESEVKDFAPAKRSDLTVAGTPARLLTGPGVEADDGDPGSAEVTIFALRGKVFVLVSHGEGTGPADRHEDLAKLLAALKA